MVRRELQGGAIACSVLMIYGWAQATTASESPPPCDASDAVPSPPKKQANCRGSTGTGLLSALPERLAQLQWSRSAGAAPPPLPREMEATYQQLLTQAQSQVQRGQIVDAMTSISGIPKNSRAFAAAQQLRKDWSQELLRQATQTYRQAKMDRAIALLNAIPTDSDRHARAMELRQQWNREGRWLKQALHAKQSKNWRVAVDSLRSLQGTALYQSATVQNLLLECLTKVYEPDGRLVKIAMEGMPMRLYSP